MCYVDHSFAIKHNASTIVQVFEHMSQPKQSTTGIDSLTRGIRQLETIHIVLNDDDSLPPTSEKVDLHIPLAILQVKRSQKYNSITPHSVTKPRSSRLTGLLEAGRGLDSAARSRRLVTAVAVAPPASRCQAFPSSSPYAALLDSHFASRWPRCRTATGA